MYKQNATYETPVPVKVVNYTEVPPWCYCSVNSEGIAALKVFAVSRDGQYLIAEGQSDHTAFMLFRVCAFDGACYTAEFLECGTNPIPSSYARLSTIEWYDEYGFCKLHFTDIEQVSRGKTCRRLYFDRKLYEDMRLVLQGQDADNG